MLTVAIGWPMELAIMLPMSWPILNAMTTLIPSKGGVSAYEMQRIEFPNVPHPISPEIPTELTMAHGTAVLAFEASSLM